MSFREVGVKFVQIGLTTFAREVDRANRAVQAMTRVQIQNARANIQAAQAIDRVAVANQRSMVSSLNAVHKALGRYSNKLVDVRTKLNLQAKDMGNVIPSLNSFKNAVAKIVKTELNRAKQVEKLTSLDKLQGKELSNVRASITNLTKSLATLYAERSKSIAQEAWGKKATKGQVEAVRQAIEAFVQYRIKLLETGEAIDNVNKAQQETAVTGAEVKKAQGFWEGLRLKLQNTRESFQKVQTVVGAVIGSFNAAVTAIMMVGQVIGKAISIVSKAIGVVVKITGAILNAAVAIGKTLLNAILSIVKIPFNVIKKGFDALVGSLQRIFEITIGMNLSRIMWGIGRGLRSMAEEAYNAGVEFQLTQIRIEGLLRRELVDQGYELSEAVEMVGARSKELLDWIAKLAVISIYGAEDINKMFAYAMSFRFTTQEAKDLTEASLNFATGMGLTDVEMMRIIENFGQMRQQGKLAGTELRDLARGAFLPISDILEQMGVRLDLVSGLTVPSIEKMTVGLKKARAVGELSDSKFREIAAALEEMSYGGSISAAAMMKLYNSGVLTNNILEKMGTSFEAINEAASDMKLDQVRDELNRMIREGETSVDEFFWAFMDIVKRDFSNSMEDAAATMKHAIGNIHDYIQTIFGWRLLSPATTVIAERINTVLDKAMAEPFRNMYDSLGKGVGVIVDIIATLSDIAFPFSVNFEKSTGFVQGLTNFFNAIANIKGDWNDIKGFLDQSFLFLWTQGVSRAGTNQIVEGFKLIHETILNLSNLDFETIKNNLIEGIKLIWEPIWNEGIKPKLKETFDNIKNQIMDYWETEIKPKLLEFLVDVLLPGLHNFITVTIPSWANTLAEQAPKIAQSLNTTILGALTELTDWANDNTGESSALTLLLNLLKSLSTYVDMKLTSPEVKGDPHAPWQVKAADMYSVSGLADAIRDVGEAAREATQPVDEFVEIMVNKFGKWLEDNEQKLIFIDNYIENASLSVALLLESLGLIVDVLNLFSKDDAVGKKKPKQTFLEWVFTVLNSILEIMGWIVKNIHTNTILAIRTLIRGLDEMFEAMGDMFFNLMNFNDKAKQVDIEFDVDRIMRPFEKYNEWAERFNDTGPLESLKNFFLEFKGIWDLISSLGNREGGEVKAIFNDQFEETVKKAEWMKRELIGASIIPDMVTAINTYLAENVPGIETPFVDTMGSTVKMLEDKIPEFKTAGKNLVQGFLDGMKLKFAELLSWWAGALIQLNNITETINNMGSPSKLYKQYGEYIMEGFKEGLTDGMVNVKRELSGIMTQSYGLLTASGSQPVTNNNYQTSMDNRNIIINMQNGGNYLSLDYEYVRAIT